VSRAFSESGSISKRTRQTVLEAAAAIGYRPNAIARSLIRQRSDIVGLVMADMTNPFYPEILVKFTEQLRAMGKQVLLFTVPPHCSIDDALPQVLQYQVGGVVITSATVSSAMAEVCQRFNVPVVLFNRSVAVDGISAVCCDNAGGARAIVDHFVGRGRRRLGFLSGDAGASTNIERESSFRRRATEHGILSVAMAKGNFSYEGGYKAAVEIMARHPRPDALFAANDVMALGAMDALRYELHLEVPRDVAVIGFDDISAAAWPSYRLTTFRQPTNRMVAETIRILHVEPESNDTRGRIIHIAGRLIVRGSA
jgi:DNA-binding LacI/PurR family transcriptional regulator